MRKDVVQNLCIKRGQLVWVDFKERDGSCQSGKRPAVIIQNDRGNKFSTTTMVIPITSKNKRDLPVHIKLTKDYDIAYKGNILMAEQLTVIDKSQILAIGDILDEVELKELDKAMTIQLDLSNNIV